MSVTGTISPVEPCHNCDADSGSNTLYIENDMLSGTPDHVLATGRLFSGRRTAVVVCDVCLFTALRAQFGHLMRKRG
jgi:hypothetical protein